jgi:asparagine N-glycosylation enzyme membrane subunit Stt3
MTTAAAYFLIWFFRPQAGRIPGVWDGSLPPSHWVLAYAAALAIAGFASVRWPWAGIALVLVAASAISYALTNHAVQWSSRPFGIHYAPVIVIGAVISIAGLAIRAFARRSHSKAGA